MTELTEEKMQEMIDRAAHGDGTIQDFILILQRSIDIINTLRNELQIANEKCRKHEDYISCRIKNILEIMHLDLFKKFLLTRYVRM